MFKASCAWMSIRCFTQFQNYTHQLLLSLFSLASSSHINNFSQNLLLINWYNIDSLHKFYYYLFLSACVNMFLSCFINRKKYFDLSFSNIDKSSSQAIVFSFNVVMTNIENFDDDDNDNETTFISNFISLFIIAWFYLKNIC